ncbi:MAG TPA: hypothetical protein PKO06_00760 [Candidatus Ozemobacteraceae bacterium]|nr:hypothetical protein [Candidatus Ozemobacteraceae bacterium]
MVTSSAAPSVSPDGLFASTLIRYLLNQPLPLSHSLQNRQQLEQITDDLRQALSRRVRGLPSTSPGHTLTAGGTLLYWLGFYAGFTAAPVLGFAIALLGSAGISAGYKFTCEAWRNFEYLRLFYTSLALMQNADHTITEQERRILSDFLLSLELSDAEKNQLREITAPTLEDIKVPEWVDTDQRRSILSACWSLVYCDGVQPSEGDLFSRLSERFDVSAEEATLLCRQAEKLIDRQEEDVLNLGRLYKSLTQQPEIPNALLEALIHSSVKWPSREAFAETLTSSPVTAPTLPTAAREAQFLLAGSTVLDLLLGQHPELAAAGILTPLTQLARAVGRETELAEFHALCAGLFHRLNAN